LVIKFIMIVFLIFRLMFYECDNSWCWFTLIVQVCCVSYGSALELITIAGTESIE